MLEQRLTALRELLRQPLGDPVHESADLTVLDLSLERETVPSLVMRVRVVDWSRGGAVSEWLLRLPQDEMSVAELDEAALKALWIIYRANLEEWWDLHTTDPDVAAWGTQVEP